MPHLASFREGWTNERFAEFVLSQMCFVSRPSTIADDIGTDFGCTLFERLAAGQAAQLVPRSSFVVQVKSSARPISLTKHVDYLSRLEVPFFVGIPERARSLLRIYSGRYLPYMFALRGPKLQTLTARLVPARKTTTASLRASVSGGPRRVVVAMPKIATLKATASADEFKRFTKAIEAECQECGLNVLHRLTHQFVFAYSGGRVRTVLAGSGSSTVFRANFGDRLLEYCRNLLWLRKHRPSEVSHAEIREILAVVDLVDHRLPKSDARKRAIRELRLAVRNAV